MSRELDILVAEKIFDRIVCQTEGDVPEGWRLDDGQALPGYRDGTFVYSLPLYSTDIGAAWEVAAKAGVFKLGHTGDDWECEWRLGQQSGSGYGPTAELAICRAALLAVGVTPP